MNESMVEAFPDEQNGDSQQNEITNSNEVVENRDVIVNASITDEQTNGDESIQYDGSSENIEMPIEEVDLPHSSTSGQGLTSTESDRDPLGSQLIKTEPIVLGQPCSSNNNELDELLDITDDDEVLTVRIDDELTFYVDKKVGFAKPHESASSLKGDRLIKRENDVVSGNLPFNLRVSTNWSKNPRQNPNNDDNYSHNFLFILFQKQGHRIYMLGTKQLEIPKRVIETFREYNTIFPASESYDQRMTVALLLMCVSTNDLATHTVDPDIKEFISGKLLTAEISYYVNIS